jgi:regulator of nucleoside diphosphate kinase
MTDLYPFEVNSIPYQTRTILLNSWDFIELHYDLVNYCIHCSSSELNRIKVLLNELEAAICVLPQQIPRDLVTLNSVVEIQELNSRRIDRYVLTLPSQTVESENGLSVISPLGQLLLGARIHEIIEEKTSGQLRRYQITRILYQPEAAGDHHDKKVVYPREITPKMHLGETAVAEPGIHPTEPQASLLNA